MRSRNADTPEHVQAWFDRRLMDRFGEDRLRMACDMFDAAVQSIVAALPSEVVDDNRQRGFAVLQRMYGVDFSERWLQAVVARAVDDSVTDRQEQAFTKARERRGREAERGGARGEHVEQRRREAHPRRASA